MPSPTNFYDRQSFCSKIKTNIIVKYFSTWISIMDRAQTRYHRDNNKLLYIDLFSGPGTYEDGEPSTPISILEATTRLSESIQNRVSFLFNDSNEESIDTLRNKTKGAFPTLFSKCTFKSEEIGHEDIEELADQIPPHYPSLCLLDPWGYKGLSLDSISKLIKNWGSEVIFFFNYSRVIAAIPNPRVSNTMKILLGEVNHKKIINTIKNKKMLPAEKEIFVIRTIENILKSSHSNYTLPFKFIRDNGGSHYLIYATKSSVGFLKMKEIMARESSEGSIFDAHVFCYKSKQALGNQCTLPFEETNPTLEILAGQLLIKYTGKSMTMLDIYLEHGLDTIYTKKQYKDALRLLYEREKITTDPQPRKGSFADRIMVIFPPEYIQE